jgi:hypothetical protein
MEVGQGVGVPTHEHSGRGLLLRGDDQRADVVGRDGDTLGSAVNLTHGWEVEEGSAASEGKKIASDCEITPIALSHSVALTSERMPERGMKLDPQSKEVRAEEKVAA